MTSKEFFEQNRGKDFKYLDEIVRVVGYDYGHVIISIKKGGLEFGTIHNVDRSLLHDGEKCLYVSIESLKPIEPQEIDLCEILKSCEGMVFYSTMVGYCRLIEVTEFITIGYGDDEYVFLESDGKYSVDGECTIFPSKENRDWSTFVKPIRVKEGDPVMTKWNSAAFWKLENYTKDNKSDFIVPVSDFDFTDFDSNKSKSIV